MEATAVPHSARKIRILTAKVGLDGHDRGVKVISRALRDAGVEVIYTGLHQTPAMVVEAAIQEDVDGIGISLLSGAHMTLFPEIIRLLKERDASDIVVFGGGIIPDFDVDGPREARRRQGLHPRHVARRGGLLRQGAIRRGGGGLTPGLLCLCRGDRSCRAIRHRPRGCASKCRSAPPGIRGLPQDVLRLGRRAGVRADRRQPRPLARVPARQRRPTGVDGRQRR